MLHDGGCMCTVYCTSVHTFRKYGTSFCHVAHGNMDRLVVHVQVVARVHSRRLDAHVGITL
jgi:hypothetical protein